MAEYEYQMEPGRVALKFVSCCWTLKLQYQYCGRVNPFRVRVRQVGGSEHRCHSCCDPFLGCKYGLVVLGTKGSNETFPGWQGNHTRRGLRRWTSDVVTGTSINNMAFPHGHCEYGSTFIR